MEEEGITLYGVAETHLRDLERPPVNPLWNWAGCNRESTSRKNGGVGFLWREGSTWTPLEDSCVEHTWLSGYIHATPVLACVVYLGVSSNQHSENSVVRCIRHDIERWGHSREVLILGDFNGHIQELDGYTDHNGKLLLEMAQELSLEIANLWADCEGTRTWCARGQSSCIDYALVLLNLGKTLQDIHIDEEGRYIRFLPEAAYEEVANEFEPSPSRNGAETYEQYIDQLRRIMRKHEKIVNAHHGVRRKSWWDGEVQAALKARRAANRYHRHAVKSPQSEDVQGTWLEYLHRKREMHTITQRKIAEANHKTLQAIKSAGRGAAAKFWTYVSRLDGKAAQPEVRTESTGAKENDLHRALTDHLWQLYAPPPQGAPAVPLPALDRSGLAGADQQTLRLMQPHRWARRMFDYIHRNGVRTRWTKRLQQLSKKYGFFASLVQEETKRKWAKAVETLVRQTEVDTWQRDMEGKSTLKLYREHKQEIRMEPLYDNSVASSLLFEARAGALRTLVYRRRYDDNVGSAILTPVPIDGTTLPLALGFSPRVPSGGGGGDQVNQVATTKSRLLKWWAIVRAH
ncbi:hypothetical protein HPB49_003685 [Dermacentor silvarum]|uniref:Uncharacterized protein n=1 Tax=Dermacentor silvarum TaxID=543639 RepID=A0ACB8DU19_DERSI|nr:hypothetical protein HPB49_003685 [Dermacentor silvarum]